MTFSEEGEQHPIMDLRMPEFAKVQQNGMAVYVLSEDQYIRVEDNQKLLREVRNFLDMFNDEVPADKRENLFNYLDGNLTDEHLEEIEKIFTRSTRSMSNGTR